MVTNRLIISLLLTLFYLPLKAQWRIIYRSEDVMPIIKGQSISDKGQSVCDTNNPIILIEPRGKLSKKIIIRYAHSKRVLIDASTIWGFTDSTNVVWRYYDGDLCRLISYNGAWAEYAIYRTYARLRTSGPEVYYQPGYSRTLDSEVETAWRKAMEHVPSELILRNN